MNVSIRRDLAAGLRSDRDHGQSPGSRLCRACVDLIAVAGAGIMLMDERGRGSSLGLSDDVAGVVEDLQFTLGEGPGIDAHVLGTPALGPQLDDPVGRRWPAFAPAAVSAGILAAFAFPLRIGAIRVGSLDLYHDRPGALDHSQMADSVTMADIVTQAVIAMQAGATPGELADEMDNPGSLRAQVYQASGMISQHLEIGIGDALVRLRAHAYADGRPINDVAGDVVGRRLRLE